MSPVLHNSTTEDAIIIDGSVIVNMLKPATEKTLQNNQERFFHSTFNLSSLMLSVVMSYGMNILQTF